ncbi:transporter [Pseudomonas sp. PDM19]|uniref:transporter n=1 Tax=Pseudomonas sp. PDM19 TaxID=2769272 RepID=UPI0021F0960B|nr:transporter [Pseudomonas sp. PDM19]
MVGYLYRQVTGDSVRGAVLGDFKSQVCAVGPQVGHFLKVCKDSWYANLKGYYEFDANNRAEG